MVNEKKRLIRARADKSAKFKRDGFGKKPQISDFVEETTWASQ